MTKSVTKKYKSLTSRFVLSLIIINAILLPGLFYGMFSVVKYTNNENFVNQARLGSLFIATMTRSIINKNQHFEYHLSEMMDNILIGGDVVYLELIADGKSLLKKTADHIGNIAFIEDFNFSENADDIYFISVPLQKTPELGRLETRVGFDESFLKHRIDIAYYQCILIILMYVAILLVVSYGLTRRIIAPLNKLRRTAKDISSGKFDHKLEIESDITEINGLCEELEFMRNELISKSSILEHMSLHDMLTGLPNRRMLNKRLSHEITVADKKNLTFSLMLIDLNGFKDINDSLGHHAGDFVLQKIAERIKDNVGDINIAARLGGDEFAILVYHDSTDIKQRETDLCVIAKNISKSISKTIDFEDNEIVVTASIGISFYPEHAKERNMLLRLSDTAMYECKKLKTDYVFYHSDMGYEAEEKLKLRNDLRLSLEQGEFDVYYQPKIRLSDGKLLGFEALARWFPKERQPISPEKFIPVMEKIGLINDLMRFVLDHSVNELGKWHKIFPDLSVAVNLSAINLTNENLPEIIFSTLSKTNTKHEHLELELTESAVIEDPLRSISTLENLYNAGIKITIDDFGTGYSSFSYLKELPVTTLKIDKSFVMNMLTDNDDLSIVKTTIEMAHNLDLSVVAEGVEDNKTKDLLAELGCDMAQGYLISLPLSSKECIKFIENYNSTTNQSHKMSA
ncbi:MAG: EAL domain-containing protein [Proteobacteria bacterium]|nr:EAL domain-containing protein [Pseudomonadota bacterium]